MDIAGYIGHANAGIVLYKNVWSENAQFVERLELVLADSKSDRYKWNQAMVGDQEIMKDYRDCSDFKLRQGDMPIENEEYADLESIYKEIIAGVRECVSHYSGLYNLSLGYEEATNFVKYNEGQHFSVHADSGFSYSCAVSTIGYINDGYKGGEYLMPYQGIKFMPEKGDLIMHPSDFVYAHSSLPVSSGTKYSVVTMYDYNDRNHSSGEYGASSVDSKIALNAVDNKQVSSVKWG